MKIIAGQLGGRSFTQPPTRAVRPLSEKVRGALFDVVGDVTGLTVLDAYAGSGAAGFEAISRGASMVEAIEANARVAKVIEANQLALGIDWGYSLRNMTVSTWLALPANQGDNTARFDLIIADPPYDQLETDILERLVGHLNSTGVLAVSHSSKRPSPVLDGAQLVKAKVYGDTSLSFYKPSV